MDAASGWNAYKEKGSQASLTASGTIAAALLLSAALMSGSMRVPATLLALGEQHAIGPREHDNRPLYVDHSNLWDVGMSSAVTLT